MDLQQIWNDAIDRVAATISDEQKKAILFGIIKLQVSIQIINNVVIFTCNNELTFSLLSTQYVIPILNEIKLLTGQNLSMQLQMSAVNQAPPTVNQAPVNQNSVNNDSYQAVTQASMAPSSSLHKIDMPKFMRQDRINPEKTFESYVCDKENFLIYTIAQKIDKFPMDSIENNIETKPIETKIKKSFNYLKESLKPILQENNVLEENDKYPKDTTQSFSAQNSSIDISDGIINKKDLEENGA